MGFSKGCAWAAWMLEKANTAMAACNHDRFVKK
jgi:hypothetical protein